MPIQQFPTDDAPAEQENFWDQSGAGALLKKRMAEDKHLDNEGKSLTVHKIRQLGFRFFPVKFFSEKLVAAYEDEWDNSFAPVVLDCLVKDRDDRKNGKAKAAKVIREMDTLFMRFPIKIFTEKLQQARADNPLPPKWPKSLARVHLKELVAAGFDRDNEGNELPIGQILEMDERFLLYPDFKTNLIKMRDTTIQLQLDADRDQIAINHHLQKHPPSTMDAPRIDIRGNLVQYPKWQGSAAKLLLLQDLLFLLDHDLLRGPDRIKPQTLHSSHYEYEKFPLKVFRQHIYQEFRSMKQTNWNNHQKREQLSKLK
jgi:hypothetical protein